MNKYYLYWYRLPEHTDPYTQGYIGVTNDLKRRHNEHKYSSNKRNKTYICTHFTNAINLYGGIDKLIKEVLHEQDSYEEVYTLERKYRPSIDIGWNIAVGGEYPGEVSPLKGKTDRWDDAKKALIGSYHKGKTISEEHKKALSQKNRANVNLGTSVTLFHKDAYEVTYTFHSLSEASRQLDIPLPRLKSKNLRKKTSYGEDGWAILFDESFDRSTTPTGRQLAGKEISKTLVKKKSLETSVDINDIN